MSDYENDGSGFDVWTYVAHLGCRIRPSSDPFFADGDAICQVRFVNYSQMSFMASKNDALTRIHP